MKSFLVVLSLVVLPLWQPMAQTNSSGDELEVENLMVLFREGRPMPDGTKEENSVDISFEVRNAKKADRAKVVVKQKSTAEILEVKTIRFSERDGLVFYNSYGHPRRMKRNVVSIQLPVGTFTREAVSVQVFAVDKNNQTTKKLEQ